MKIEELIDLGRALPDHQPSATSRQAARMALLDSATEPSATRQWNWKRKRTAAVVGCVAAAITAVWFVRGHRSADLAPSTAVASVEILRVHDGRVSFVADAHPIRVLAGDGEVEVLKGDVEVSVDNGRLAAVGVTRGSAVVSVTGQPPVVIGSQGNWKQSQETIIHTPLEEEAPNEAAVAKPEASDPDAPRLLRPRPKPVAKLSKPDKSGAASLSLLTEPTKEDDLSQADRPTEPTEPTKVTEPTEAERSFSNGYRALRLGNYGEAIGYFEISIAADPSSSISKDARYWHAVAVAKKGRGDDAAKALSAFIKLYPRGSRSLRASVILGWILFEKGQLSLARSHFNRGVKSGTKAVAKSARDGLEAIEKSATP